METHLARLLRWSKSPAPPGGFPGAPPVPAERCSPSPACPGPPRQWAVAGNASSSGEVPRGPGPPTPAPPDPEGGRGHLGKAPAADVRYSTMSEPGLRRDEVRASTRPESRQAPGARLNNEDTRPQARSLTAFKQRSCLQDSVAEDTATDGNTGTH
nr:PREDICTED: circumsporozoite protein-like [Lepisosteus oculatus]